LQPAAAVDAMSQLEDRLAFQCRAVGLPAPEREVRLIPGRRFRWDFVWRQLVAGPWGSEGLAVEVQGGTWSRTRGAHSRGAGQSRDAEKLALATLAGWRCLTVTADQIRSGVAVGWIERALAIADGKEATTGAESPLDATGTPRQGRIPRTRARGPRKGRIAPDAIL
jgi:hypothetical protein